MSSISRLVLSQARSAVDEAIYIVQGQIKAQSERLAKQIEASSGMRRQFGAPPTTKSVVGDMNPTTAICQPLGLPLGNEHPGTILRRSERLAARRRDHGANAEGAEPPEHGWDFYTGESFTTQILDLPPRPRTYSERGMDVTIKFTRISLLILSSCWSHKVTANLRLKLSRVGRVNAIYRPNRSS